jgi:hypothetical protein
VLALVVGGLREQQAVTKAAQAGFIRLFLVALTVVELGRMDIYLIAQ